MYMFTFFVVLVHRYVCIYMYVCVVYAYVHVCICMCLCEYFMSVCGSIYVEQ